MAKPASTQRATFACRVKLPLASRVINLCVAILVTLLVIPNPAFAGSPGLVISQVYGGGGNSTAPYTNDYVELFNRGTSPISVSGWSVQYGSPSGSVNQVVALTGLVQPGRYYLVALASGGATGASLPAPDATGVVNISSTAGKIALVSSTTPLSCTTNCSSASIVDFVGYGTTATAFETAPAPTPSNSLAVLRRAAGCTDTDNNTADFLIAAPAPRNSGSPGATCPDIVLPVFKTVSPISVGRTDHTQTLLPSGKILVTGGTGSGSSEFESAEIYDPATNVWSPAAPMSTKRGYHTATLLRTGKVLVVGGYSLVGNGVLATAEIYDPATDSWSMTGSLAAGRLLHTATLLASGRVLVAGGYGVVGSSQGPIATAEIYDPTSNAWASAAPMNSPRTQQTATLLRSGQVLIAGGVGSPGLATCEIYDPLANVWTPVGSLANGRRGHTSTLLVDGTVLAVGGEGAGVLASVERFDPSTNSWSPAPSLAIARRFHSATLLASGALVVAGGQQSGAASYSTVKQK